MDEPTSSLSRREAERLFEVIDRLRARGVGVDLHQPLPRGGRRVADRYTVLRDGRSVESGDDRAGDDGRVRACHRGDGRPPARRVFPRVPHEPGEPRARARRGCRRSACPIAPAWRCAAARSSGIAGLVGAGPHRAAARGVRPRSGRSGRISVRGGRGTAARRRGRGSRRASACSPRTARTKARARAVDRRQPHAVALPARIRLRSPRASARAAARALGARLARARARSLAAGRRALGRQPAEGRARAAAAPRRRRAAARRADARHRRGAARPRSTG